jgi:hypothetical protein
MEVEECGPCLGGKSNIKNPCLPCQERRAILDTQIFVKLF